MLKSLLSIPIRENGGLFTVSKEAKVVVVCGCFPTTHGVPSLFTTLTQLSSCSFQYFNYVSPQRIAIIILLLEQTTYFPTVSDIAMMWTIFFSQWSSLNRGLSIILTSQFISDKERCVTSADPEYKAPQAPLDYQISICFNNLNWNPSLSYCQIELCWLVN